MRDTAAVRAAIVRAAQEDGVNPAYALAVADRESSFNPAAKSSKTIRGIYQMRGDLRAKYGVGDSPDAYQQAKGWNRFMPDIRKEMASTLGRDPTDTEAYLGHHFGGRRAGRMLRMDPSTPVDAVFTPDEMAGNPHFARAGTVGALNSSVMTDVDRRTAKFGGAEAGAAASGPADLSSFGEPVQQASSEDAPSMLGASPEQKQTVPSPPPAPDLSSFGTPVNNVSTTPTKEDFSSVANSVAKQYPALAPHVKNLIIQRGTTTDPKDDRQLEFYQPWDSDNPNPGKLTTELYNKKLKGQDLTETIAGDMLHHLGSVNPTTGQPVDPKWMQMKQQLIAGMGPDQTKMDQGAYQQEKSNPAYQTSSYEDWMKNNRSDAYIRGALFPNQNAEWQEPGIYTPAMQQATSAMRSYLTAPTPGQPDLSPFGSPVEDNTATPMVPSAASDLSQFGTAA